MKTLLFYYHNGRNLTLAKKYLEMNGITRLTLCPSRERGARAEIWTGGEDGSGWVERYAKRNDAKRDLALIASWEGFNIPQYCEKKTGQTVLVTA